MTFKFFKRYLLLLELFSFYFFCCQTNQNEITKSLIDKLESKRCIVVDKISNVKSLKYFSSKNIFTTYTNPKFLIPYLKMKYPNSNTAIIVQIDDMIKIFNNYLGNLNSDEILSPYTWIVFEGKAKNLATRLKPFYIPYNCDFFIITPVNDTYYEVEEMYNLGLGNDTKKIRNRLGYRSQGKLIMNILPKVIRRINMKGEEIFIESNNLDTCSTERKCYHADILRIIGNMMNATTMIYYKGNATQKTLSRWTSTVHSEIYDPDLGTVDILGPIFNVEGYFYIKDHNDDGFEFYVYLRPFSKKVWLYVAIFLATSSISSFLIEFLRFPRVKLGHRMLSSFNFAMQPFETICEQCGSDIPESTPSRLAWLSIRLAASILVPAYSAAIVSFLTVSIPELPFTDLRTFLQDGTYNTSGVGNSYSQQFFLISTDPVVKEISEKLLIKKTPADRTEAMEWICRENFRYAHVTYNTTLNQLRDNKCKLLKIPRPIFRKPTGLKMRPNSPYRNVYQRNLYYFYTSGILDKMNKALAGRTLEDYKEEFIPITLNRIGPLAYVVVLGYVSASTMLMLEIFIKNLFGNKNKNLTVFVKQEAWIHEVGIKM